MQRVCASARYYAAPADGCLNSACQPEAPHDGNFPSAGPAGELAAEIAAGSCERASEGEMEGADAMSGHMRSPPSCERKLPCTKTRYSACLRARHSCAEACVVRLEHEATAHVRHMHHVRCHWILQALFASEDLSDAVAVAQTRECTDVAIVAARLGCYKMNGTC